MPNLFAIPAHVSWAKHHAKHAPGLLIAGKYRLERLLAEGGMGTVWLARNEALDLHVALKLILPEIRDEEMSARLLTEARATAKLLHPSIVRVFDFGQTEQGDPFIIMELLEGCSLGQFLAQQPCDPLLAVRTLLPVIDALCHAHAQGIVHRDLKPDNIFLVREEHRTRPKLLDFGIAKVNVEGAVPNMTGPHFVLGSPGYMSPEQAWNSQDVDHRADIWSVCVVLYEAVSGGTAFKGGDAHSILNAVKDTELAPLAGSDAARALWPLLARGLVKDPAHRYQSMRDLGNALASWLAERGVMDDLCGDPLDRYWNPGTDGTPVPNTVPPPREQHPPAVAAAAVSHDVNLATRNVRARRNLVYVDPDTDTTNIFGRDGASPVRVPEPRRVLPGRETFVRAAIVLGVIGLFLSTVATKLTESEPTASTLRTPHVVVPAPSTATASIAALIALGRATQLRETQLDGGIAADAPASEVATGRSQSEPTASSARPRRVRSPQPAAADLDLKDPF